MTDIKRPFDLLESLKGQIVYLTIKENKTPFKVQLLAFDANINLVIILNGKKQFIHGTSVIGVEEFK